jgi:hypothetical protein
MGDAVLLEPDVQSAIRGSVTFARLLKEAGLPKGLPPRREGADRANERQAANVDRIVAATVANGAIQRGSSRVTEIPQFARR